MEMRKELSEIKTKIQQFIDKYDIDYFEVDVEDKGDNIKKVFLHLTI